VERHLEVKAAVAPPVAAVTTGDCGATTASVVVSGTATMLGGQLHRPSRVGSNEPPAGEEAHRKVEYLLQVTFCPLLTFKGLPHSSANVTELVSASTTT
jgi:hypothetical protein